MDHFLADSSIKALKYRIQGMNSIQTPFKGYSYANQQPHDIPESNLNDITSNLYHSVEALKNFLEREKKKNIQANETIESLRQDCRKLEKDIEMWKSIASHYGNTITSTHATTARALSILEEAKLNDPRSIEGEIVADDRSA